MPDGDPILRAGSEITPPVNTSILGADSTPKQPSRFSGVLRGVAGVAASMIPGLGGIGSVVSGALGGGPNFGAMQAMIQQQQVFSTRMLMIQNQVSNQSQEFTSVSNLLKARHDAEMSAVNNFKS